MDVSNKTLALFVVVAMVVSLTGFLFSFSALDGLSGRATTATGLSNFTINSSISVAFLVDTVQFGVGTVNGTGAHNCTLNTSGPGMLDGAANSIAGPDCIGFNATIQPLVVQNQGNQNVTLNISFNGTAAEFVGGTTPSFTFRATWNESNSCGFITNFNNLTTSVSAANTNFSICNSTGFSFNPSARTLNLDLGIKIPQDAPPGTRRVTITAFAST
jgi:hypothetical protein